METHGIPHQSRSSKLNEAFKVDISLSSITRQRVCKRNKLHPPSYFHFRKWLNNKLYHPHPLVPSLPAQTTAKQHSKSCPSALPLNHLKIDYLKPPRLTNHPSQSPQAKWLIFQGFTRKSNIAERATNSGPGSSPELDDAGINKSLPWFTTYLSLYLKRKRNARKLEKPQALTPKKNIVPCRV